MLFLSFLSEELRGLSRPISECISDFCAEGHSDDSFFSALERGTCIPQAYENTRAELSLPEGMEPILSQTLGGFGSGGRAEELRRLEAGILRARPLMEAERAAYANRVRLCRTLTTASAMGLVILLL